MLPFFSPLFLVNKHRPQLPISQNPHFISVSLPHLQPQMPPSLLISSFIPLPPSSSPSWSAPPFLQDFWQVWGVCRVACVHLNEKLHFVRLPSTLSFILLSSSTSYISVSFYLSITHSYNTTDFVYAGHSYSVLLVQGNSKLTVLLYFTPLSFIASVRFTTTVDRTAAKLYIQVYIFKKAVDW